MQHFEDQLRQEVGFFKRKKNAVKVTAPKITFVIINDFYNTNHNTNNATSGHF